MPTSPEASPNRSMAPGRIRRQVEAKLAEERNAQSPPRIDTNSASQLPDDYIPSSTPQRASDLIGGSGVSLDGRSLIVPNDREFDDLSSINTNQYGVPIGSFRIVGAVDPESGASINSQAKSPQSHDSPMRRDYANQPAIDNEKNTSKKGSGCLPLWITEAPFWLKMVIVLSLTLLVGAIALIGVGAALAVQDSRGGPSPSLPQFPVDPSPTPPVQAPTAAPVDVNDTPSPSILATPEPSALPDGTNATEAPAGNPGNEDTAAPTQSPTMSPTSSTVSFMVTGGRFTGDALDALPEQLTTLPNIDGNTVMFHLGDWNSPYATSCVEESYQTNVDLYRNSSVPVYFVPGDNEFNDCPNPIQAFEFWHEYILDFETKYWPAPSWWTISRQEPEYAENFAYVYNRILFVGINLVGGKVHDTQEWQDRHQANLDWIQTQYQDNSGEFDVLVVLGHADPDISANDNFFSTFFDRVENEYDVQVLFVHRNLGAEPWAVEHQYNNIDNLLVVVMEGSVFPPMLIQIDASAGIVDIDQDKWYDDYLKEIEAEGKNKKRGTN